MLQTGIILKSDWRSSLQFCERPGDFVMVRVFSKVTIEVIESSSKAS